MSEGDTSPPCQSGSGRPSAPDVHTEEGNRPSGGECVCLRREVWLERARVAKVYHRSFSVFFDIPGCSSLDEFWYSGTDVSVTLSR